MGKWAAFLFSKTDVFIAELPIEGISMSWEINGIPTATISVNFLTFKKYLEKQNVGLSDVINSGFRYVDIRYNDTTALKAILAGARLVDYGSDVNLELDFKGWLAYFTKRKITKKYTNTDAGAIAWDIIDTVQSEPYGDIGITEGVIEATKNRDREYSRDEVFKSLYQLSNSNIEEGFEFEITNDKALTIKEQLGSLKDFIVFDEINTKSRTVDYITGLSVSTKVTLFGEGSEPNQLIVDRTAPSTYLDKWYLLEDSASFLSVKEAATLEDHGDKFLELNRDFRQDIKYTVIPTNISLLSFNVGDTVRVKYPDLLDTLLRIRSKTIEVSGESESSQVEFI